MNRLLLIVFLSLSSWELSAQKVIYVDGAAGDDNRVESTSWASAYKTIAKAIASSPTATNDTNESVEIWIKAGTYPVSAELSPKKWVHLYGGFAGTETSKDQRTKKAGGQAWDFANASIVEPAESYSGTLLKQSANFDVAKLTFVDGLSFCNSQDTGLKTRPGLRVQYCTIEGCANQGMLMWPGGNIGYSYFGFNHTVKVQGAALAGNFNTDCTILIEHCTFEGNRIGETNNYLGGHALHIQNSGGQTGDTNSIIVRHCTFFNNGSMSDTRHGAAIQCVTPWATISNCLIYNNGGRNAVRLAGANGTDGLFCNNTIVNNAGSGLYIDNTGTPSYINNTLVWSRTPDSKSPSIALANAASAAVVKNSAYNIISPACSVTKGIVLSGDNNEVAFVQPTSFVGIADSDAGIDELRNARLQWALQENSYLTDKGDRNLLTDVMGTTDIAGNQRVKGTDIEIGAFENNGTGGSTGGEITEEQAVQNMVKYYRMNCYRKWSIPSDLQPAKVKEQLTKGSNGRFADMNDEQTNVIESIVTKTGSADQAKVATFLAKAFNRLWILSEEYRSKTLSSTDFPELREAFWAAIVNYSKLERKRPNNSTRFHTSCFAIPTATVNTYFSLFEDMDNVEKGTAGYEKYKEANQLIKDVSYQAWTQPFRGDATDNNPVQVERFRSHVWWVGGNALTYRSLLPVAAMKRSAQMFDVIAKVAQGALSVTSQNTNTESFWTEGFTADGAGWGHGKQNIVWGYPSDGCSAAVEALLALKDTPWAKNLTEENAHSLLNFFRGGAWYYHNRFIPPCLSRNSMNYSQIATQYIPYKNALNNVLGNYKDSYGDDEQQELSDLSKAVNATGDIMMNGQPLGRYTGTRWFYNNDDLIKKNSNYYWLINMASHRCDGIESAHEAADRKNIFTCDGLTLLQRKGDEYLRALGASVLTALPGITARQCEKDLVAITNWGGYSSLHDWAAGATRGDNAVAGFIFEKMNTQFRTGSGTEVNPKAFGVFAQKGYFIQADYLICLGAGVTNKKTTYPESIYTTLDQTLRRGKVIIATPASSTSTTTDQTLSQTVDASTWVAQEGGFAYKLLAPYSTSMKVTGEVRNTKWTDLNFENSKYSYSTTENILQLSIDHGAQPVDATYGYVVYGGSQSADALRTTALPFEVMSNTKELQAVRSTDDKMIQALFYESSKVLKWGDKSIAVSSPCALQIEEIENSFFITVSDATMNKHLAEISVTTTLPLGASNALPGSALYKATITLPQGENAGASVTIEIPKSGVNIKTVKEDRKIITVSKEDSGLNISTTDEADVQVCDITGAIYFSGKVKGTKQVNLSSGSYIVSAVSSKGTQVVKLTY